MATGNWGRGYRQTSGARAHLGGTPPVPRRRGVWTYGIIEAVKHWILLSMGLIARLCARLKCECFGSGCRDWSWGIVEWEVIWEFSFQLCARGSPDCHSRAFGFKLGIRAG